LIFKQTESVKTSDPAKNNQTRVMEYSLNLAVKGNEISSSDAGLILGYWNEADVIHFLDVISHHASQIFSST
jgi:hypothetical protein